MCQRSPRHAGRRWRLRARARSVRHYQHAQQILERLRRLGIDYDDVVQRLEDEGVAAFEASWDRLREHLATTPRATDRGAGHGR
ncbi:transaldolase family protein [Nonomuraea sp. NPDC048901]|uniref:transaldolase family protein n=1 Tax=Nonomuraea sp. NPDC048901 TaxID=3155627 RepID=UPI0033F4B0D4